MLVWFGLFTVFIVLSAFYVALPYISFIRKKIPFVPPKFPYIFGSVSSKKHNALQFADFYNEYRTNQPIIGINMMLKAAVLIVDFDLIQRILTTDFKYFKNRGMYYNDKDPLSTVLGSLDHDQWKSLRKKLTPAFTSAKMKVIAAKHILKCLQLNRLMHH